MIRIGQPQIQAYHHNMACRLISHIIDEQSNKDFDIWFETTEEYGKYLSDEVCDSFVVAMLLPAVQTPII